MATITITVTVAGGKFVLDGVSQATYSATPGNTYKFDQSDGTNGTHPLSFATAADAAGSTEYTTGVTTSGTPGSGGAYTQIEVTATTVQALHYYCSNHSGMGGLFNVGGTGTVQYQDRAGFAVQNRTSDPVPFAQAKINDPYVGSWSAGGNLNVAKSQIAGFGTVSAAGAAMGRDGPGTLLATYEVYNGTSWTESTDINTAGRNGRGAGTTTAAVVFGGWPRGGATETWNGSAWTEANDMTRGATASQSQAAFGTNTAALAAGGEPGTGGFQLVETWNGSSWTEVNELNTGRQGPVGFGTTTAGFVISGYSPPAPPGNVITNVESWNGSAWTETTDVNTARGQGGASGNTTAGIIYGGDSPPGRVAVTESWDGSAWTEVNDLATAKSQFGFNSNPSTGSTNALAMGGETPSIIAGTEEWTFGGIAPDAPAVGYADAIVGDMYYNSSTGQFKAIKNGGAPIGTWASGGNLNAARYEMIGLGVQTASLGVGGTEPPGTRGDLNEEYNGTAWTEKADLNTGRTAMGAGSNGTVTAGLVFGGATDGGESALSESWNGSAWTETNDLNVAHYRPGGAGTSTAALAYGGTTPPLTAKTESWNGSSWTEVNDLNTARQQLGGGGTSTSAIATGGQIPPASPPLTGATEAWDGSSWTEVSDMNTARYAMGYSSGSNTSSLVFGGELPPGGPPIYQAKVEGYNGTSWTEVNDLSAVKGAPGGSGSSSISALSFGGQNPGAVSTATEEFSADDFQIKTVTTS